MKTIASFSGTALLLAALIVAGSVNIAAIPAKAAKPDARQSSSQQKGSTSRQKKKVRKEHARKALAKRKQISSEAVSAIRQTQNALRFLSSGDRKQAIAALEKATGKLDVILAREPDMALAPVDVSTSVYDVLADVEAVNNLKDKALAALKKGRLQEARLLIRNLASETVISVTSIPLATYPAAIKTAVGLIDKGKSAKAQEILQTALSTLVVTDTVIPLPISTAGMLLDEAEKLGEKTKRSKEENNRLASLLKMARQEVQFAEALGYGSAEDFRGIYEEIDKIAEKTGNGKSGSGFFDRIRKYLKHVISNGKKQ